MPLPDNQPVSEITIVSFNPVLGTPAGARFNMPSPVRGRILECGFEPNSLVASAITMAVATDPHTSSTASNFTQFITSTLGTFSSTVMYEGATCSVVPASPTFVNAGDAIQYTFSGGNTSAIGGNVYCKIRRV